MRATTALGKVIWFLRSPQGSAGDCVDWAISALCEGLDSEHLRVLAGADSPYNDFEIIDFATKALSELGIEIPVGSRAVSFYAKALAAEILEDRSKLDSNLRTLFILCSDNDCQDDLMNFYLLHCAKDDLEISHATDYWQGATRENIIDLVLDECRRYTQPVASADGVLTGQQTRGDFMGGINYLFPPDQIENLPSWRFILHFRETGSSDAERLQTASELLKSAEFQIAHFPSGLGLKVNQDTRSIDIRVEVPEERRKKSDSLSLYESDVWKILGNMASCGYEEVYYEAVDWKETELPTKKWWQFWK